MEETLMRDTTTVSDAAVLEEIDRMFAEMNQANERTRRHQEETDKLRVEAQAVLAKLKAK